MIRKYSFVTMSALCALLFVATTPCLLQAEEWAPEKHYAYMFEDDDADAEAQANAAANLSAWAKQPLRGQEGRVLPFAGSWSAVRAWDSSHMIELIERGHHVMLVFEDPSFRAFSVTFSDNPEEQARNVIDENYREGLEYAHKHNLPIAIRGWNWAYEPVRWQDIRVSSGGATIPDEERANIIVDGKPVAGHAVTDPFGPVQAWREWGEFWLGNEIMRQFQEIYPDPPLVLFLNNNEAGEFIHTNVDNHDRFIARYGEGPHTHEFKVRVIRQGYQERYDAMFEAARTAAPAWKEKLRFVAYNSLWGHAYIGHGNQPRPGTDFNADQGWTRWLYHPDGSMPELYDNDWQPGKADYRPWSPQTEAMNYYSMQDRVFQEKPDFHWTSIVWDGGEVNAAWRGRRSSSKPYHYVSRGQRWDFERYEGWVQFCLWTTRPSFYTEFRWDGGLYRYTSIFHGTYMALINSVDRVWKNGVLREFWRLGELVPNRDEQPWFQLGAGHSQWLKDLERWYLLTCDANPPRDEWTETTRLRVFAQALVLGEAPNRRWLIYGHAPLGAVPNATLKLPGLGDVTLESVSKSGSFFLVTEQGDKVETLLAGGPAELSLTADKQRVAPGDAVAFEAAVAHAPGKAFAGFTWSLGDGTVMEQVEVSGIQHAFRETGEYIVTLEGRLRNGGSLVEQVVVFVGDSPHESVVYDLSLQDAFAYEGPWEGTPTEPVTYRHVPNRGSEPSPVVTGGRFVNDPERGRVLEITEEDGGIWMVRDNATSMDEQGHPNRTISFWFRADELNRRQMLFASGYNEIGMNIYLHDGKLYAGSWAVPDGVWHATWFPVRGYHWKGDWISTVVEPERWYHVAWVLKDGKDEVEPDRQHLYVNGELIGTAPGARLTRHYAPPRLGRTHLSDEMLTRFHDQDEQEKIEAHTFRGRLSQFQMINAAVEPQ